MLLAQDAIIDKMDEANLIDLLKEIRKKYYLKLGNSTEYCVKDYFVLSDLVNKITKKPLEKKLDELNLFLSADTVFQSIASIKPQFLAISETSGYSQITIYTPKGTSVSALKFVGTDYNSSEKNELKNYWLNYYNNRITFKGEATYAYNCHAYAWYCSEGHSYVWINTPGDDTFWNDGSYVLTNTPDENCKVSYLGCDHSAITSSRNGYFISKWAFLPLFEHLPEDCPFAYTGLRYYTYPDPTYNTVPPKPSVETFRKDNDQSFTAVVSCDSRYNVDQYEWKSDYPSDWSIVAQNASKSSVKVYRSSSPRSCNLSARAHNSYGWGEWQVIGWLYASSTYSLSVLQNPVSSTLQVQIAPNAETQTLQDGAFAMEVTKQRPILSKPSTYSIGLYSSTGTCVYQNTVKGQGESAVNLNIDVSSLLNGIYILHVKTADEDAQTLNIVVKH